MTPNESLKPCPFCGSRAVWFKTGRCIGIECADGMDCPGRAQTNVYDPEHRQTVIEQWNLRAPSPLMQNGPEGETVAQVDKSPETQGLAVDKYAILQGRPAAVEPTDFDAWWETDGPNTTSVYEAAKSAWEARAPAPISDERIVEIWSPGPSRPVLGKNKIIAFARALLVEAGGRHD